jgi:hypothetical protein
MRTFAPGQHLRLAYSRGPDPLGLPGFNPGRRPGGWVDEPSKTEQPQASWTVEFLNGFVWTVVFVSGTYVWFCITRAVMEWAGL